MSQVIAFVHKAIEMTFFRSRPKRCLIGHELTLIKRIVSHREHRGHRGFLDRITGFTEISFLPADAVLSAAFSIQASAKPAACVRWDIRDGPHKNMQAGKKREILDADKEQTQEARLKIQGMFLTG